MTCGQSDAQHAGTNKRSHQTQRGRLQIILSKSLFINMFVDPCVNVQLEKGKGKRWSCRFAQKQRAVDVGRIQFSHSGNAQDELI